MSGTEVAAAASRAGAPGPADRMASAPRVAGGALGCAAAGSVAAGRGGLRGRARLGCGADGRGGGRRRRRGGRAGRDPADVEAALEAVEARGIPALTRGGGEEDPGGDELELEPRRRRAGHLGEAGVDDVGGAGQGAGAEGGRLVAHPLELVLGEGAEDGRRAVRHCGDDDEVAQPLEEVLDEAARVEAGLDDPLDGPEGTTAVGRREGVDGRVEELPVGEPEQGGGRVVGEPLVSRPGDELVEDRQRVADRPATGPDDEGQHAGSDVDALLRADLAEVVGQLLRRDEAEGVVVGAAADRPDDLVRLGRREDELHVLGRLLDDLEQGVEALRRHHVRLVDDVDLVPALGRAVARSLPEVTGVVDATVARRVDLDDVDGPRAAAGEGDAGVAGAARLGGRTLLAVEAAGEDAGARRLAAAARAGEEVGMPDPAGPQRLHERARHVVLADDVRERLRPVSAVEGGAHPPHPSRAGGRRVCRVHGPPRAAD